ncbi:sigma-70 family RNA polymerase sigma factor [uncultured Shewanella sp.]|uniref:sigma-70 family RNA polymerase sigma factor n=1 Tax=uncultured Shewanella sp. TaxID=173975 RepID=UPI002617902E|nr:sigma-70 family RNA polymerase sigma factor [uncultured Shewanella sp.]
MQISAQEHTSHKEGIIPPHSNPIELCDCLERVANQKDKHAFTHLFTFFAPKIKRFGLSKLNTDAMANELLQDTMSNVWRKAHLYQKSKGAATTWVYTIMRNACFDMLRKMQTQSEQTFSNNIWPIDNLPDTAAAHLDTHEQLQDHLQSKLLLNYIDTLPPAQQEVVKGIYYQELSQEQLAQLLNVPLGTIKSRLRLALAKLKQYLGDHDND